jgi:hypothetical protein
MKGWNSKSIKKLKVIMPDFSAPKRVNSFFGSLNNVVNAASGKAVTKNQLKGTAAPQPPTPKSRSLNCETCGKGFKLKPDEDYRYHCCMGCHIHSVMLKLPREILERLYIKENQSISVIAKQYGFSEKTIVRLISEYEFQGSAAAAQLKQPVKKVIKKTSVTVSKGITASSPDNTMSEEALLKGWKQGWRQIGDKRIYARSAWEGNFARYLQFLKERKTIVDWQHEPDTFWFEKIKRGVRSYLPDFKVFHINGTVEYYEVKGYYDAKSKTKTKRMAKYFPHIKLVLIDSEWFKRNRPKLKGLLPDWE